MTNSAAVSRLADAPASGDARQREVALRGLHYLALICERRPEMRCEECGRVMENAEMWQLGGDRNAPTSWSMRQMCWECRAKVEPARQQETSKARKAEKVRKTNSPLSKTVIAEVNEAARAFESDPVQPS
jgi:hypothetical protein